MLQIIETQYKQFVISTDPARLDLNAIHDMLSRAYWAKERPREITEAAIKNSLVFGIYEGSRQIGVARVVSDYNVFAYLCDVFIHEDFRAQGIGKWLMQTIVDHPGLKKIYRFTLATHDAHGLYKQFGFNVMENPENWMQRIQPYQHE